jgi:prolyl-tRNA editing enzyme YbaK/EbsC (Cys-tRNA(Pro) deacylase)
MSDERRGEIATTRVEAVSGFLDGAGVAHELVEHAHSESAAAEARVTDHPPETVAKTIVLHDRGVPVIAAIPASDRLDLGKLRELLGASRQLRLASEDEIARDFPSLEVGAIPPFGPVVPAAEVIDRALVDQPQILCSAGDHRHSVLVDPREVVRITAARVADICEE